MCAHPDLSGPHIPVLLGPLLAAVAPVRGRWIDATFGAGGYSLGLLEAGADHVTGIDRDPLAIEMAAPLIAGAGGRLDLVQSDFAQLGDLAEAGPLNGLVDGIVFDLGVSSMQLDQAERGFSFLRDGPLDMRMAQAGPSAADLVNEAPQALLADILYQYGEERAARRIARALVAARAEAPITTTAALAEIVSGCLPRAKPGQSHPATRSFQALRIAVNDEFGQLVAGLEAAERALAPGGALAVVSFHSMEDRVVKRFLHASAGRGGRGSRHGPELAVEAPRFTLERARAIAPQPDEIARNPRARSAQLRVARRTDAPARPADRTALGLPPLSLED